MSKGPGTVEKRIAGLLGATRDRALSVDEICNHAFSLAGVPPTRAQRLSATRAAHRVLRRVREAFARHRDIVSQAHVSARAALGLTDAPSHGDNTYDEYQRRLTSHPEWPEQERLWAFCENVGIWSRIVPSERRGSLKLETDFWCTATTKDRRLWFHPPDVPVCVWAVSLQPAGVIWAEADVTKITERNVVVRYRGETARLDRDKLWRWWAWWRGVMFVSSRTGRIANELDAKWQERYGSASGSVPPVMQMPIAEAMRLLGVPADYSRDDVLAAFRRAAKESTPGYGRYSRDVSAVYRSA